MPQLIKRGEVIADDYALLREVAAIARATRCRAGDRSVGVLAQASCPACRARRHRGVAGARRRSGADRGRRPVAAGDRGDFPSATDGRGYSSARLLRERYGFAGELRAIGDIQRDQLFYLREVGFDAFAVRDDKDVVDALFGLHDFTDGYQNSAVRTPWFRRRSAQAPPGDVWFPCA